MVYTLTMPVGYDASSHAAWAAARFVGAQVGKPYRWGAVGPQEYDCSGLIQQAYIEAGVFEPSFAPRTPKEQWEWGIHWGLTIGPTDGGLLVGDLLFYMLDWQDPSRGPGHVAIVTGRVDTAITLTHAPDIDQLICTATHGWIGSNGLFTPKPMPGHTYIGAVRPAPTIPV